MEIHQEIERHEEELKSLLTRVLREPLHPLHERLQALSIRLDELEDQIEKIREEDLTALHQMHEKTGKVIDRLLRDINARMSESESTYHDLLSSSVMQLTQTINDSFDAMRVWSAESAQGQRNALANVLANQLSELSGTYERTLNALGEDVNRGGDARWQKAAESFKLIQANLGHRLTNLEATINQMDTVRRLADESQENWRVRQEKWQSASIERAQAQLSAAVLPLRKLLIVTLALAGASFIGLVFVGTRLFL